MANKRKQYNPQCKAKVTTVSEADGEKTLALSSRLSVVGDWGRYSGCLLHKPQDLPS
jgi:hypothetical protein